MAAQPAVTLNYGLRYERINPFTEAEDRLNGFVPGQQSTVRPDAPVGLVFPGDAGIGPGSRTAPTPSCRAPARSGTRPEGMWSVRASYGLFYDQFQNGAGTASQVAISATPWAQFNQFSGAGLNFQNPYGGAPLPAPNTFVRPSTVFALDADAETAARAELERRACSARCSTRTSRKSATSAPPGTKLPRNVEANPAVYGPGATAQNADRRRLYANCPADGGTCDFSTVAMLRNITRSSYQAAQASLSRRFAGGVGFNASYWSSRTFDDLSSMNLSGAAAKPLAGENDLAQNPFDLDAEYGPSLFDARHRLVASASWMPTVSPRAPAAVRAILGGWQLNGIATHNSGTPFTVSDSANVALAGQQPADLGLPGQPPQSGRRSERRAAHRQRVAQPIGLPAPEHR